MFFVYVLFCVNYTFGQVAQNGTMYISDNTYFFLSPGVTNFSFGTSPATTTTTRTNLSYGKLFFDNGVTWSSGVSNHVVNGYVGTLSTSSFTFPIGDGAYNYSPARVSSIASNSAGIDAAYWLADPSSFGTAMTSPVTSVTDVEYWVVKSSTASSIISLSWNSNSDIAGLTGSDLTSLSIVGWNGSAWVEIPSTVDTTSFLGGASTLTTGSISSDAAVNLSAFQAFTFGVVPSIGVIATINCAGATNNGNLYSGAAASGVSSVISYTGGNGGTHAGQVVTSTGITGLTATLASGNFAVGNGNLTYTITGTPSNSGTAYFAVNIGGVTCSLTRDVLCGQVFASTGTKTWNGGWVPAGSPTLFDDVIIAAPYSNGSFTCNSLTLNADISLFDDEVIEIVNGVSGSNKIVMSTNASVIQRGGTTGVGPNIQLTKQTRSLQRGDYTYFGTPIAGNFFSQLAGAQATTGTLTGALDGMYKWVSGTTANWQNLTSIETGKGFIARIKHQAPFYNFGFFDNVNVTLNGISNNGDVSVPVITSADPDPDHEGNYNLLANPYPSAIFADKFLEDNLNIDGVVYIWKAQTQQAGSSGSYTQADYIAYTKMGTVYPGPNTILDGTFNGRIASGQGFMVKALGNGNVNFTNCLRLTSTTSNNSFFRSVENEAIASNLSFDRFKLTMTNSSDVFSQILIGYNSNCTNQYDRLYDASRNSVSTSQLFSLLEDGKQLAINARPSFSVLDVVPVGVSKSDNLQENFTISISEKEGIFENGLVNVFLHDKLLNIYHNFQNGNYNFSTSSSMLLNRFDVVYQDSSLSNPTFDNFNFSTYISNEVLNLASSTEMSSVEVFDITGRIIESFEVNEVKNYTRPFIHAESVYIVKVKFVDGMVGTQKLINKK
jgi:hypothetical protein